MDSPINLDTSSDEGTPQSPPSGSSQRQSRIPVSTKDGQRRSRMSSLNVSLSRLSLSPPQSENSIKTRSQSCADLEKANATASEGAAAAVSRGCPCRRPMFPSYSSMNKDISKVKKYFQEKHPSIKSLKPLTMDVYIQTMNLLWRKFDKKIKINTKNLDSVGEYLKIYGFPMPIKMHALKAPTAPHNFRYILSIWVWLLDMIETKPSTSGVVVDKRQPVEESVGFTLFHPLLAKHFSDQKSAKNKANTQSLTFVFVKKPKQEKSDTVTYKNTLLQRINQTRAKEFQTRVNHMLGLEANRSSQINDELQYFKRYVHDLIEELNNANCRLMNRLPSFEHFISPNNNYSQEEICKELIDFKETVGEFEDCISQEQLPLNDLTEKLQYYNIQIKKCIEHLQSENNDQMLAVEEMLREEDEVINAKLQQTDEFISDISYWKRVRIELQFKIDHINRNIRLLRERNQFYLKEGSKMVHIQKLFIIQGFNFIEVVFNELIRSASLELRALIDEVVEDLNKIQQKMLENLKGSAKLFEEEE